MRPFIALNPWDRRQLLLNSLIGSVGGVLMALAVLRLHADPAGLAMGAALGTIAGLISFRQHVQVMQQINDLAHDIRAPLTRLLLRVDELGEQDQHASHLIAGLKADLETLLDLNEDFETIGQSTDHPSGREWVQLETCCRQVTASYAPAQVQLELDPGWSARVDRRHLQRTLHNLIDNALEYGGTPVLVQARTHPGKLELAVEDSGASGLTSPLPEQRLPKVHQGLGWANARRFCHSHGGEMTIGHSGLGGLHVKLSMAVETRSEASA